MSDLRKLTSDERRLLRKMILHTPNAAHHLEILDSTLVQEFEDGGMGSLRFVRGNENSRRLGSQLIEMEFTGDDGVPILAAINLDQQGELLELDMWKVDDSPLHHRP